MCKTGLGKLVAKIGKYEHVQRYEDIEGGKLIMIDVSYERFET